MQVSNLTQGPPRRWNVEISGTIWLPRLIDKARAQSAGTLGDYLYGQSPIDRSFLRTIGLSYATFTHIVLDARDDGEVVAAIRELRSEALDRARAWTRRVRLRWLPFFLALDLDDGYVPAPLRLVSRLTNALVHPLMSRVKRRYPLRLQESGTPPPAGG